MVSVVIPARNAADVLPTQLAGLSRQDYEYEWEIVVVDNGSTDGTAHVAMAWTDRLPLRVVPAFDKPGVNYARNVGVHSAEGDLIAFCDADDEVSQGWLTAIVEASLESDAVGGALDMTKLNDPVPISSRNDTSTMHLWFPGRFLPAVGSGNLAVWLDVLEVVEGFNEEYVRATDTEFCWRLQLTGYQLGFSRQALVHCRTRDNIRGVAKQFYSFGRAQTKLYRDFRSAGMPRSSIRGALKGWAWLIIHLPDLARDRSQRKYWVTIAARRAGRVIGSIENRGLYL